MNSIENGTVERWCLDFILETELESKLAPSGPGDVWATSPVSTRVAAPGRPVELRVVKRSSKTPTRQALVNVDARAKLLHTFLHHELQAAELFAWAVLAFPETPREFRRGLVRLAREELGHLALYRRRLEELGFHVGQFAVRDWFWSRVGACPDPAHFVALLGLGFEGANLEHTARFAEWFGEIGDGETVDVLQRVERDEVGHVQFAREWFERFTGEPLGFDSWAAHLPDPISPALFVGRPMNREARERAGFDAAFLDQLGEQQAAHIPRKS